MMDFDLGMLYQVETRVLKQAVKRNLLRFPEDFMFQLTHSEWQEVITNCDNLLPKSAKFNPVTPMAFTEQRIAMLSSVLKSIRAIHVNIQIIRIFTRIRKILADNSIVITEVEKLKSRLGKQDKSIELIFQYLDQLLDRKSNSATEGAKIGYLIKGRDL